MEALEGTNHSLGTEEGARTHLNNIRLHLPKAPTSLRRKPLILTWLARNITSSS